MEYKNHKMLRRREQELNKNQRQAMVEGKTETNNEKLPILITENKDTQPLLRQN